MGTHGLHDSYCLKMAVIERVHYKYTDTYGVQVILKLSTVYHSKSDKECPQILN